ncbi:primosomal protein N' [bacterium]|nr:primosomal protein N' [bacterium]
MVQKETKRVDVVLTVAPFHRYTYSLPPSFQALAHPGVQVWVPLGRRKTAGIIAGYAEGEQPGAFAVRPILDILDPDPLFSPEMLGLTKWISDYYLAPWGEVMRAALPAGAQAPSRLIIHVEDRPTNPVSGLTSSQKSLLSRLSGKRSVPYEQLKGSHKKVRADLGILEKEGFIRLEYASRHMKQKTEIHVSPSGNRDAEKEASLTPKQKEALAVIRQGPDIPRKNIPVSSSVLSRLEKGGWIRLEKRTVYRDAFPDLETPAPPAITLTPEQESAVQSVSAAMREGRFQPFLLFGVTGSGKTQVYIELVRKTLAAGRSALVLVPEISLTPQAVQRYRSHFGAAVAVLHSRMSDGERYDSWSRIRRNECRIALGPRSAVFAPLLNLGLIVVDEEHESSYKQMETNPRYHARDVAVMRAKRNGCPVVLGSATPSLETYHNSVSGKYTRCELTHRIDHVPLPDIRIVQMQPYTPSEKQVSLSPLLRDAMQERLSRKEQIILLQNRRGYAVLIRCSACGMVEQCPHCSISLTYHQTSAGLICHYCGHRKAAPSFCSACGGSTLKFRGVGTQKVESDIRSLFPDAGLLRMDLDTVSTKNAHARLITEFDKGRADILLGTQMVAKGHDFPGVSLVGIISADTGLHFPDFRSGERTYQLLTQAAGRAGRRERGLVIIQSQDAENPVIRFSIRQDYAAFYRWEIVHRRDLGYPPFGRMAMIRFRGKNEGKVCDAAKIFIRLLPRIPHLDILGPVPSPLSRIRNEFRYQALLRIPRAQDASGAGLRNAINTARKAFDARAFRQVHVAVDMDPVDML